MLINKANGNISLILNAIKRLDPIYQCSMKEYDFISNLTYCIELELVYIKELKLASRQIKFHLNN